MIIVYHEKDGEIYRHYKISGKTMHEVMLQISDYNSRKFGDNVYAKEVPDNSLTAYLFRKAEQRVAFNKDEVMDVKLKLRELESCLDDLCE